MTHRWVLRPMDRPEVAARLQQELNNLPEALARALVLRGIDTFDAARLFFRPSLDHLHDPFLMRDMDRAADRLAEAIQRKERVLVYGDYDVDGTTATALMTSFLRAHGVEASYFIPNRFEDGYGLGPTGIDQAADVGASLIVALDCGITAVDEAAYARQKGLDLIICDHHKPADVLPNALAVLDPKRSDGTYPFDELSGCGIGFKLIQATLQRLGAPPEAANAYLDLVAVSTASDIVPLYGENRVLMAEGLKALRERPRVGLQKLAEIARVDLKDCTVNHILFSLAPRINAAGRLGDAGRAVELLLTTDPAEASELANRLEAVNQERRTVDREMQTEAFRLAERQLTSRTRHAIVLHRPHWHLGVLGIVASRVVERFYRPAIMLGTSGDEVKGSARSIGGISVHHALQACSDLLVQFGGHDFAAGLTLREADVPAFQERFDAAVGEQATPDVFHPTMDVDAHLDLSDLDERFWAVLKQFAPFGPENLAPTFQAEKLEVVGEPRTVGKEGSHLKFGVRSLEGGASRDVIAFRMGQHLPTVLDSQRHGRPLELLFSVEENVWRGRTSLQLKARDLRLSEGE
ncbi:MAG: single-stranded-DNA-specific exonuclease RecJ [Rhodothermales bacterium]